jgi:exopolysaccharide production protein ExoQ
MNPSLAALVYAVGIVGLFYLDRDKTIRTSWGLWLPILWLLIVGSRGPSIWLGVAPPAGADVQLDGTPLDRAFFAGILAVGIIVFVFRGRKVVSLLAANWLILGYFGFCLASVLWSDYPGVASKRWVKAIGDLVMVLIIASEADPVGAFKRVVARVGFILLPVSVLLIKYFPLLGRGYDPWHGTRYNLGVTTNKNTLGMVVLVITLATFWRVWTLFRTKGDNRTRHLVAQATLLAFGISLLSMANSATSRAGFALGAFIVVVTSTSFAKRRPGAVHAIVLTIVIVGVGLMLAGGGAVITNALGRDSTLTGRTGIWNELLPMVPNPVVGAGFESFWLGTRLDAIRAANPGNPLNEAHNGYLEVYLNLGCIGLLLIGSILITGYKRAASTFRRDPSFGSLLLAYVAVAGIYSVTEAGFRNLCLMWIFFLFTVVAASAIASGKLPLGKEKTAPELAPTNTNPKGASDRPLADWQVQDRPKSPGNGTKILPTRGAPLRSNSALLVRR